LLAPCSLRPSGHWRCASFALPSASVGMTHYSAAQRRLKGALPSRKARLVIDEVAKLIERNGTCQRMSLQGKRARCRAGVRAKPSAKIGR
jgi:hypothetical protein